MANNRWRGRSAATAGCTAAALSVAALLAGCSAAPSAPAGPSAAPGATAAPVAPPAACVLDTRALADGTGVMWTPDASTASDTRCVYDPSTGGASAGGSAGADGPAFVAVDIAPAGNADAKAALDVVAQLCDSHSRAPANGAAETGFVCRFQGGNVFAAAVRGGQLVTVSTSAVPTGTTGARLSAALTQQLGALR